VQKLGSPKSELGVPILIGNVNTHICHPYTLPPQHGSKAIPLGHRMATEQVMHHLSHGLLCHRRLALMLLLVPVP